MNKDDKICWNCKHITDIHHVDKNWCLLKDEPVKFNETCDFFEKED